MRSRRNFVSFTAGVVAACASVPVFAVEREVVTPEHSDAHLLEACAAFFAARASRPVPAGAEQVFGTPECKRYEASLLSCFDAEAGLFHAALELPACTITGLRAKVRLIKAWDEHEDHVDSLLDDLLAGSAVA